MRVLYSLVIAALSLSILSCKSKTEVLAEKYNVSEKTVSECMEHFSGKYIPEKRLEKALEIISKEQWFFGLFGPTCRTLADESKIYNSPEVYFDARKHQSYKVTLDKNKDQYFELKAKEIEEKTGVNNNQAKEWLEQSREPFDSTAIDDVLLYFCKSDWGKCKNSSIIAKKESLWYGGKAITTDSGTDWRKSQYFAKFATAYNFLKPKAEGIIKNNLWLLNDTLNQLAIDLVICVDNHDDLLLKHPISFVFGECFNKKFTNFKDILISADNAHNRKELEKKTANEKSITGNELKDYEPYNPNKIVCKTSDPRMCKSQSFWDKVHSGEVLYLPGH